MDSLKLSMVILFFWIASPVSGHMISRLEAMTDERLGEISVLEKNNGIRVKMEDRASKFQDDDFHNKPSCTRPADAPPSHESVAGALGIPELRSPDGDENFTAKRKREERADETV